MPENFHDKTRCPLCKGGDTEPFHEDAVRIYMVCSSCQLVFVPTVYWLSLKEERATYDLHENDVNDPGYRRFLSRLTTPLLERLEPGRQGLDFGCGPGPALASMLEERGHRMELYDPFYANNPSVLNSTYDFICATEVVEHLRDPDQVFNTLFGLLKPGGLLGIMTKLVTDKSAFSNWHYIRDLTHICFFHRKTFYYLARHFGAELNFSGKDVILLQLAK